MKILTLIILMVLFSYTTLAEVNHYYKIDLLYNQGNVSYNSLTVEPTIAPVQMVEGRYVAEVVSFNNQILNFTFFDVPLFYFYEEVDETGELTGGSAALEQAALTLYVPYYSNAKEINIYDQDLIERLHIDVGSYAQESTLTEAKPVRKEIKTEVKTAPKSITFANIALSLGLLLLFIFIILVLLHWRKR
ncbi:hypothetical protein HYV87_03890 [Candidatus Woesearchaeota archaeon]|nr:hypothetical protein [Candidatus Woesearchaeota archaeon]